MILAESLFSEVAQAIGIPSVFLEGGTVGVLAFVLAWMVRVLWLKEKEDAKQLDLPIQIVSLFAKTLEGFDAMKNAINQNTEVLLSCKEAFEGVAIRIGDQVMPLKDDINKVRQELLSNKRTRVVIKDSSGKTIAEVVAKPVVDENGEQYLEVQYDLKKSDELPG